MEAFPTLSPVAWGFVIFAAFLIGVAKTGLPGIGIVSIAIFTLLLPAKTAVGSVLLLLIGADIVAICTYRREAEWAYLGKLFPFAAFGVVLGTVTMKWLATVSGADKSLKQLIGGILIALVGFQLARQLQSANVKDAETAPVPLVFSAATGILAGFTTMVANAAGPIMVLYFLAMRLPKVAFVGTTAWFFFAVNVFKVPFGVYLGTVSAGGLLFALALFPAALLGGLSGRFILKYINQQWFEWIAIGLTLIAGIRLVL